jgi:hypothetical protein
LASPQAASAAQTPPVAQTPVRLEDVVVDARRLEGTTEAYLAMVAIAQVQAVASAMASPYRGSSAGPEDVDP